MVTAKVEEGRSGDYPVVKPGLYLAKVLTVALEQSDLYKREDGTPQENINFKFEIVEGEFETSYVWGRTPPWFNSSPQCKFRKWSEQIMGVESLPTGYELNSDVDLVGKLVQVWVQHGKTGKPKVTDVLAVNDPSAVARGATPEPALVGASAAVGASFDDQMAEEPF